jgi:UDP-glucose 4-epimerase
MWRINGEATRRIAQTCAQAGARLVYASTVAVFGQQAADRVPADDTPPVPDTEYGKSKWEAEQAIRGVDRLSYVILRFPLLVGPFGRGNMERLLRQIAARRYWPVRGESVSKSWLSFDDAAAALTLAAHHTATVGQTFIVSRPEPNTLDEIQQAAYAAMGRRCVRPALRIPQLAAKSGGAVLNAILRPLGRRSALGEAVKTLLKPAVFDGTRFSQLTQFAPREELAEALGRTASWLKSASTH